VALVSELAQGCFSSCAHIFRVLLLFVAIRIRRAAELASRLRQPFETAKAGVENSLTNQPLIHFPHPVRVDIVDRSNFGLASQNILVRQFFGREWTYAASVSPLGFRVRFLSRHRWQPLLEASAGLHFSARDVPVDGARSFNFTFQFGTGVEWYGRERRALRFEFLLRHISNAGTGATNPGVDAPTIRVAYSFWR